MTLRRSSVRLLGRAGTAALVAAGALLSGAPDAAAAEDETPVVSLDPPDAELFLLPTENLAGILGGPGVASTGEDGASVALAEAAALAPPEIAETLGAEGVTPASHSGEGEIDVEYGGTVVVRLPALVDASAAVVSLDVLADDPEADPHTYSTDPAAGDPLVVSEDPDANAYAITLPDDDGVTGPGAFLTFDGLTSTDPAIAEVYPLDYYLEFTDAVAAGATVTLEPASGVFAAASCSVREEGPCPAVDVRAGESFDVVVPPTSLLRTLDFGDLTTAAVGLLSEDEEPFEEYYSGDDPGLLTRRGADAASVNLPADMGGGTYLGAVLEGDPFTGSGYALTFFEVEVAVQADAAPAPLNAGLRSDTGWVEDVRGASAGSTKAVAGITMLLVAGLITVVAVAPRRRPPAEG